MSINNKYSLLVCEYANKHYINSFKKKYKSGWKETWGFIDIMCCNIDKYLTTTKVEKIFICDNQYIAKCEFTIAWSNISTHASWNRIIIYVNELTKEVHILLLYMKTNIWWTWETSWWKEEIKDNHKEIAKIFNLK